MKRRKVMRGGRDVGRKMIREGPKDRFGAISAMGRVVLLCQQQG